jgi:hypothetical protein
MSKQIAALLVLASMGPSLFPSLALAQFQGTSQEQAACRPDVLRHCKALVGPNSDTFAILACLQQNRPKLTKPCASVLASHGV